jgi:peptide/nickel transport system permease protein
MSATSRGTLRAALSTPTGFTAGAVLILLVLLAAFGPVIWGHQARQIDVVHILEGSSGQHLLGTDNLGRDLLARLLVATRTSLTLAVLATLVAAVIGVPFGALPAVLGRRAGRIVNVLIDFSVAFPALLLAIFVAIIVGVGAHAAVLAIGISAAPGAARLTQTLAASVAGADYVAAARLAGVSRRRLLWRHVLPNIAEPLILNLTLSVGGALLALSGLSFLGLGVQPPSYDWGRMLQDGLGRIYVTPVAALAPGAAVVIAGLAFNGLGEALAQVVSTRPVAPRGRRAGRPARPASAARRERLADPSDAVLVVAGLSVTIATPAGTVQPVREISFTIRRGEIVGIVGESGSGKSLTALAITRLAPTVADVSADRIEFLGQDLLRSPGPVGRRLLGTSLAVVFQDPGSSLNPALTVGRQLAEVVEVHQGVRRREALARAVDRLRSVRIPSPTRRAGQYPHELSGGMRQRAMIAMGLMGEPALIVADEPTSALDVTVQQEILRLLRQVNTDTSAAALLITHDIAVVDDVCHRVLVMYGGRIVEELDVQTLCTSPAHPYTRALVASVPDMSTDRGKPLATIPGRPPQPHEIPDGCAFASRCDYATDECRTSLPVLRPIGAQQSVACWHPQLDPLAKPVAPADLSDEGARP